MYVLENKIVIGVDTGNKEMKTCRHRFASGLNISKSEGISMLLPKEDVLIANGMYYSLNQTRIPYLVDKSVDERYYWLSMIAIAKELRTHHRTTEEEIILSVGLPPGHYLNDSLKNNYRNYFLSNNGECTFENGGLSYRLHIDRVVVCPQAISAVVGANPELLNVSDLFVIDIGGYTMDVVRSIHGKPVFDDVISIDLGVIHLIQKIQKGIFEQFTYKVDESQVESELLHNSHYFTPEMNELVWKCAHTYVNNIFSTLNDLGLDPRFGTVAFCGGGSLLLKDTIREILKERGNAKNAFIIEDVHANARGYERFAMNGV